MNKIHLSYNDVPACTPTVGFTFIDVQPSKRNEQHNAIQILFMNES